MIVAGVIHINVHLIKIIDTTGNTLVAVKDGFAIPASSYKGDSVRPHLLGFSVSADFFLSLFFDKPMNAKTLNVKEIHIEDQRESFTR